MHARKRAYQRGLAVAILAAAVGLLLAAPAAAAIQGPCDGSVTIDGTTYGPGNDSRSNPIVVPSQSGLVAEWEGTTGVPITDHRGEIGVVIGPGTVRIASWGGDNADLETRADGVYSVDDARDQLPFDLVGIYRVEGQHDGNGGSCSGWVMVRLEGNPLGTPVGAAAAVGTLIAGAGIVGGAVARKP